MNERDEHGCGWICASCRHGEYQRGYAAGLEAGRAEALAAVKAEVAKFAPGLVDAAVDEAERALRRTT